MTGAKSRRATIREAVRIAESIILNAEGDDIPHQTTTLAEAVVALWDATQHYESAITWECSCQRCSALLSQCYGMEQRAIAAESALAVALARKEQP
jgi:hypothetical protein